MARRYDDVVVLNTGSGAGSERTVAPVKTAYAELTTPSEKQAFLHSILTNLQTEIRKVHSAVQLASPGDIDGQYRWAQAQTPPVNLDVLIPQTLTSLAALDRKVTAGNLGPAEGRIADGYIDRLIRQGGLPVDAILPSAGEPSTGGRHRRYRKTRKSTRRRNRSRTH